MSPIGGVTKAVRNSMHFKFTRIMREVGQI